MKLSAYTMRIKSKINRDSILTWLPLFIVLVAAGNVIWNIYDDASGQDEVMVALQANGQSNPEIIPGIEVVLDDSMMEPAEGDAIVTPLPKTVNTSDISNFESSDGTTTHQVKTTVSIVNPLSTKPIEPIEYDAEPTQTTDAKPEISTVANGDNNTPSVYSVKTTVTVVAPPVVIPDPELEEIIRKSIGKLQGDIYCSDLETITFIEAPHCSIRDITGLEYCTSLTTLDLSGNSISDLTPLLKNPGLGTSDHLFLAGNPLTTDSVEAFIPLLAGRGVFIEWW